MDAATYLHYQKTLPALSAESLKEIGDVVQESPWFTDAQVLLALNLFREDHPQYAAQLRKAAIYAPDRRILKGLIDQVRLEIAPRPAEPAVKVVKAEVKAEVPAAEEPVAEVPVVEVPVIEMAPEPEPVPVAREEQKPVSTEKDLREQLLSIVHKRLAEIESEKMHKAAPVRIPEPEVPVSAKILTKEELIEKFIREEPRISTPKAAFFNPTQSAVKSNVDEEEIVTETLARLYAEQGNAAKAVKIYEKLSLLIPEKSRYFAAQIEKINLK